MHQFFAVHFFESAENGVNANSGLVMFEAIFSFDFIIELTSLKELHNNVKRILTFKHFKQTHTIFMIETAHDFYFLY